MGIVHLHLLLNHAPVIGVVFAVLFLAVAILRHSDELTRVAFGFLVLLGALTLAVFFTGEPAVRAIEKLPGFSDAIAERHEDAAVGAMIAMAALGLLSLVALVFYRRRPIPRGVAAIAILATIGASGIVAYTANLGGQIRHTEIRADASSGTAAVHTDTAESHEARER